MHRSLCSNSPLAPSRAPTARAGPDRGERVPPSLQFNRNKDILPEHKPVLGRQRRGRGTRSPRRLAASLFGRKRWGCEGTAGQVPASRGWSDRRTLNLSHHVLFYVILFFLPLQCPVFIGGLPSKLLNRPDPAELPRSDGIGHVQGGMAVDCSVCVSSIQHVG